MVKALLAALVFVMAAPLGVGAQERVTLGFGRLFTNDALGDQSDRWRTGAYSISRVRGISWGGSLPERPGEILDLRLRGEIVAPADLVKPSSGDRRYAGMLSLGLHTHYQWRGNEVSLGGDLVATGPMTGVGSFQRWIHDQLGVAEPQVLDDQIGNGIHPTLVAEFGRSIPVGANGMARPFVEVRAGLETLVRVGGDFSFGGYGPGDLMLRDPATGLRYRAVEGDRSTGLSLTVGADFAQVFSSALLPAGGDVTMSDTRSRLRAGLQWEGERASVFYGVSYLSPEFDEQQGGQTVGALNVNLRF